VETFRGLEFGALGVVDVEKVRFYRAPLRRQTFPVESQTQLRRVDIVMNYDGADGLLIRSLVRDSSVQGIVVAGLGLGDVTGLMFDAIQEARARGTRDETPSGPRAIVRGGYSSVSPRSEYFRAHLAGRRQPGHARIRGASARRIFRNSSRR
jgi:hypothetical protein